MLAKLRTTLTRWGGILLRPKQTLAAIAAGTLATGGDGLGLTLAYLLGCQVENLAEAIARWRAFDSLLVLVNGLAWALLTPILVGLLLEGLIGSARGRVRHLSLAPLVLLATLGNLLRQQGVHLPGPVYLPEILATLWGAGLAMWMRRELPDDDAAAKLEALARGPARRDNGEVLEDTGRARLLLVASELHLRNDTLEPAEAAAREATKLDELGGLRKIAERALEQIVQIDQGEFDLRKRRKSLQRKLAATTDPVARLQVFSRLRETARVLDDRDDLEEVTRQQLEFAHGLIEGEPGAAKDAALEAVRDVFTASGDYAKVVELYGDLASRAGEA
ncbi:MAG: hypothetical protein KC457_26260, partial [Myxococcales bacterium]|nr:hypothetical protein [Myxococcales bacterium]